MGWGARDPGFYECVQQQAEFQKWLKEETRVEMGIIVLGLCACASRSCYIFIRGTSLHMSESKEFSLPERINILRIWYHVLLSYACECFQHSHGMSFVLLEVGNRRHFDYWLRVISLAGTRELV